MHHSLTFLCCHVCFFWNGKILLKTVYQHEMKITISFHFNNTIDSLESEQKEKGLALVATEVHELIMIATLLACLIKSNSRALVSLCNFSISVSVIVAESVAGSTVQHSRQHYKALRSLAWKALIYWVVGSLTWMATSHGLNLWLGSVISSLWAKANISSACYHLMWTFTY